MATNEPVIRTDQEVSIAMPTDSHLLAIRQRDWDRMRDDLAPSKENGSWYGGVAWASCGGALSSLVALLTSTSATEMPTFAWIALWVLFAATSAFGIGLGFAAKATKNSTEERFESVRRVMGDVDSYQGTLAARKSVQIKLNKTQQDVFKATLNKYLQERGPTTGSPD